ncbi:hypothetical protein AJ80_05522 [Polytolypa hystricis UAMH7299]|uniref:EDC4-like protein pdc1 beta-propeller domain-containing protein n=1 Tax=Polytolypa hystricis (strain UAMH7299) TaxID=1447883 RepID=A0A2B7Y2T6_POLH7|nr:hypothetical protein AJ80_05522 [Polytolypa hystricis UAMH7299]
MSTPGDLQALFASIKPRPPSASPSGTPSAEAQQRRGPMPPQSASFHFPHGYNQPTVSSPLYSPPVTGTPPHRGSDIISPNVSTPRNEAIPPPSANADRASSLLSLLKLSQPSTSTSSPKPQQEEEISAAGIAKDAGEGTPTGTRPGHGRGISASDLVASFMGKPAAQATAAAGSFSGNVGVQQGKDGPVERPVTASSAENAQDMLLRLLNRPKPQASISEELIRPSTSKLGAETTDVRAMHTTGIEAAIPAKRQAEQSFEARPSPMRMFGGRDSREDTPFAPPAQQPSGPETIFTYINPFEQLAAASPRNRTPQEMKHESDRETPAVEVLNAKKAVSPAANGATQQSEPADASAASKAPKPAASVETPRAQEDKPEATVFAEEALVEPKKETIAEALGEVEEEVEAVLAETLDEPLDIKQEPEEEDAKQVMSALADELQKTVIGDEKEPEKVDTEAATKTVPRAAAEGLEGPAGEAANGDLAEELWENEVERVIPVYNFPIKPFVSITWKGTTDVPVSIRDDGVMDIARLKKDFDQLDRSLTSASSDYIVYALAKNGGMRIIRQEDGVDRQVFRSSKDRIFNVALCSTPAGSTGKEQTVLGIGVSGTVYWATVSKPDYDLFEKDSLDKESLVFPPFPASDENTSGGQLKTRAKRSSRHPEFFAIGRGKSIHVVWPHLAMSPKYGVTSQQRKVDTEKFFKEKSLKIATGKAGKDFIFSDDDTVIVSLDKTGRMRFWDIRDMGYGKAPPNDIRAPLLTLVTGSPSEKTWPTSVLFIDKQRPYQRATALRYVLVGLKQNHTLQLWDIALGKAIQEVNFPHSHESDAICSVAYHPASGIIVVGHPTRNSIYFIHLSSPIYSLPPFSQAGYIQQIAEKDEKLLKPESTACMSGIRELSFGNRGQLRSLELLPLKASSAQKGKDDHSLFELYVMHSRGVTCLNIKKADLGWSIDNKIVQPVNALQGGLIEINDLQAFPAPLDAQSVNGNGKEPLKKTSSQEIEPTTNNVESSRNQSPAKPSPKKKGAEASDLQEQVTPAVEKSERKKKKKTADAVKAKEANNVDSQPDQQVSEPLRTSIAMASTQSITPGAAAGPSVPDINVGVSAGFLDKEIKKIEKAVGSEFSKSLHRELDTLYHRFNEDRRTQDAAATARQDAVLRLLSSTLTENIEQSLTRIIAGNVQAMVVPALVKVTATSMDRQINDSLGEHLNAAIPKALENCLPDAVSNALQNQNTVNSISELIAATISSRVESEVSQILRKTVLPAFETKYAHLAEKMSKDAENRFATKLKQYEVKQQADSTKIDQLTALVGNLSEVVAKMASTQTSFQNEVLDFHRQLGGHLEPVHEAPVVPPPALEVPVTAPSAEELEIAEIRQSMANGSHEEASWMQSEQQAELFNQVFINYQPSYLASLAPIVALSVSVAISTSFDANVMVRLAWLHFILHNINFMDRDIVEVVPQIMHVLLQRLEGLYMAVAKDTPHDPILPKIPPLVRRARELQSFRG